MGCSPTVANPCGGGGGGSGGGGGGLNLFDLFKNDGPSSAEVAARKGTELNNQAIVFYKKGDWAKAVPLLEQAAAMSPNNPIIQKNLANARARLAAAQAELAAAQAQLRSQQQARASAERMQHSIQSFAQTLNAAPVSGGLDFDGGTAGNTPNGGNNGGLDFTAAIATPSSTLPSGDPRVVDARVSRDGAYLTDQVPELKNSPAADHISKGFQAVVKHDWPVALAWWQGALKRDPNNAALKRSVDLAQWMVDKRKATAAGPVTPLGTAIYSASRGDNAGAIRQFELAKAENPAIALQADTMINALRQRQTKDANDARSAAYWSAEIIKGTQKMVDAMFETGMNRLSIGDEKGAQEAFNDATFFGVSYNVRPSQMPAIKPGKPSESAPVFKTLPDGRVLRLPQDSDVELLISK